MAANMKKSIAWFITCFSSLVTPATTSFGKTAVLYPVNGSIVNVGGGLIVGITTDDAKQSIQIKLNDKEYELDLWDGVFDLDAKWNKGENQLFVDNERIVFHYDPFYDSGSLAVSVHQAALDNCANCHKLGAKRDLSLLEDIGPLCQKCHEIIGNDFEHSKASCDKCHESHVSWLPHLLKGKGTKFCGKCHSSLKTGLNSHHSGSYYELNCPSCHDFAKKNGQCHSCHAKLTKKSSPHGQLWEENACVSCHLPHQPKVKFSILCKGCHSPSVVQDSRHSELVKFQCEACHLMHGDSNGLITTISACASCHPVLSGKEHAKTSDDCSQCHGIHVEKTPSKAAP